MYSVNISLPASLDLVDVFEAVRVGKERAGNDRGR